MRLGWEGNEMRGVGGGDDGAGSGICGVVVGVWPYVAALVPRW